MAEQVILEFVGSPEGLKPLADALKSLGQLTDEQIASFNKANQEFQKFAQNTSKEVKQTENSVKSLNNNLKQIPEAISGGAIKEATNNLTGFNQQLGNATSASVRLTTQIRNLKNQIAQLEPGSQQFVKLSIEAAKLQDKVDRVNNRIRILASETKNLDALRLTATGIAGAFAAAQGAAALLGGENEDLQKALLKVQASLAVLNGLQAISETLNKKNAAAVVLSSIAQRAYAFVIGTSTGALKAFRIALAATGIGLIVIAIGALVTNWDKLSEAIGLSTKKLDEYRKKQLEVIKEGIEKEVAARNENIKRIQEETEKQIEATNARKGGLNDLKREIELLKAKGATDEDIFAKEQQIRTLELANIAKMQNALAGVAGAERILTQLQQKRLDITNEINAREITEDKRVSEERKKNAQETTDAINRSRKFQLEQFLKNEEREIDEEDRKDKERLEDEAEFARRQKEIDDEIAANKKKADDEAAENKRKLDEEELKRQEELRNASLQIASETINAIFSIQSERRQAETDEELARLDEEREKELANKDLTENQRAAIEAKFRKKEAKIKEDAFKKEKGAKIIEAIIATALAIIKAAPNPVLMALSAATGAISIATIAAQPVPKFAKGTKSAPEGLALVGEEGAELVHLPKGAKVIPHPASMRVMNEAPDAMRILQDYDIPAQKTAGFNEAKLAKAIAKELKDSPRFQINVDEGGATVRIIEKMREREYLNKRHSFGT